LNVLRDGSKEALNAPVDSSSPTLIELRFDSNTLN